MPPSASPPRIGPHLLPVAAGAACCCWAGLAGVAAGGAFCTLRCTPIERPPPKRRASASGTASTTPNVSTPSPNSHFMMSPIDLPLRPIVSNPVPAMQGYYAGRQIEYLDAGKPGLLQHRCQRALVGMHADGFGEVAIGCRIARHAPTKPGQHLERVHPVRRHHPLPHVGALTDDD